jgi:hypothetical protein
LVADQLVLGLARALFLPASLNLHGVKPAHGVPGAGEDNETSAAHASAATVPPDPVRAQRRWEVSCLPKRDNLDD